jgi:hypothetical protein
MKKYFLTSCLILAGSIAFATPLGLASGSSMTVTSQLSTDLIAKGSTFKASRPLVQKGGTSLIHALKRYKTKRYRVGDRTLVVDRRDMGRIMKNHHPNFYNPGKKNKSTETFFPKKFAHKDISKGIGTVVSQNRKNINNGKSILHGTFRGKPVELGYNRNSNTDKKNHVNHFFPKLGKK